MTTESTAENATRAWVDVDLGALVRNATALMRHAGVPLLPMIKADAYGLGVRPVVGALEILDPFGYGVATVDEGRELRAAALTPTLSDTPAIASWLTSGGGDWHLAIDTGMNRAGARWDALDDLAAIVRASPPTGAFTHFHSAEMDDGSMELQEERFGKALAALGVRPTLLHAENSAGITRRPASKWNLVRPGVFLFGVGSGPGAALSPEAVVSVRARVVEVRDLHAGEGVSYGASWRAEHASRVATLAIGYADGYRRSLGNRGMVLLHGRRVPVVGTVTMDMTMIDVTGVPCSVGDTAALVGTDGGETISVEDVALACGLSPYEVLTGLRQRLRRRYR